MNIRQFPRIFLFLVVLLHVTLLDFFFVTANGITFLPEENSKPITIFVHLLIALSTLLVYVGFEKIGRGYRAGRFSVREPILIFSSMAMMLAIGYLLID